MAPARRQDNRTYPENVHVDALRDDLDTLALDAEVLGDPNPNKKAKEISIKLTCGNMRRFVNPEREMPVEEEIDRGKAALTELFEEAKNGDTPVMVARFLDDIDEIVRQVRFDGSQNTYAGELEVKIRLRKTLFKYKLHQDTELTLTGICVYQEYY